MPFQFVAEGTLALTPPLGWNSWNARGRRVTDELIRKTADAFVEKGLADHGWTYICIDDGWERTNRQGDELNEGPTRDENGRFKESDDVGRSLSQDQKRQSQHESKPGQGDRGDRKH